MFKKFNPNIVEEFNAILMKNRSEALLDPIPREWIGKIEYKFADINKFDLKLPLYIGATKKTNPIYFKVKSKQQVILNDNERYVLTERKDKNSLKQSNKEFVAYSFEKTLDWKRINIEGGNYQLTKDDVHIAEGMLEKIARYSGWTIGHVDQEARMKNQIFPETVTLDLYEKFTLNKCEYDKLLWEKNVNINIGEDKPLYFTIEWDNLETFQGDKRLKGEDIVTTFKDPFYTGIKHIQAWYYQEEGNRWGIKYKFTLLDDTTQEVITPFTNVTNYKITCDKIKIIYETGKILEEDMVIYPYFETVDMSVYQLLKEMEDVFECVFQYDTMNKIINCYSIKNINKEKGLMLSFDTNVIDVETNEIDNILTGLKVIGKDDLSIAGVNIFGGDTIYNYDYFINEDIMSDECKSAWNRYLKLVEIKQEEWNLLKSNCMTQEARAIRYDSEIKSLSDRITYTKTLLSAFITAKDEDGQKRIQAEITALENRFNACQQERSNIKKVIEGYEDSMAKISSEIQRPNATDSIGKIFTKDNLEELNDFDNVENHSDEYYTTEYALLKNSQELLKERVKPKLEFKINSIDISKYFKNWKSLLELGCLFPLDDNIKELIKEENVRLVSVDYEPNKGIGGMLFANKIKKSDKLNRVSNSGKKVSQSSNNINKWKSTWEDALLSNNIVKTLLNEGLNLAAMQVNGRSVKNILDIGSYGIYVNDPDSENSLCIMNNLLAISKDNWKTSEVAISTEGINSKLLVSSIILGEQLWIEGDDGGFFVGDVKNSPSDAFGLQIFEKNGNSKTEKIFLGTELVNGIRKAKLRLIGKDGGVNLSEDGILSEIQFNNSENVDANAPSKMYIRLRDNMSTVKDGILNVKFLPFRVYSKGLMSAGQVATGFTSNSGGGTTSGGGGGYYKSEDKTSTAQKTSNGNLPSNLVGGTSEGLAYKGEPLSSKYHYHEVWLSLDHWHTTNVTVNIPAHSHWCPAHSHYTQVNIDGHIHEESKGCYDIADTKPSNVRIVVNGQTVRSGINGDFEVNIGAYLIKDRLNEILIYSDTIGSIQANLSVQYFKQW